MMKIEKKYFLQDATFIAPMLLGKTIVRRYDDNIIKYIITETEAYMGVEDKACHASKGYTNRTKIMFSQGGLIYVYLIYGMYWMLNIVTSTKDNPQAVLIRGVKGVTGPGKVGKLLKIDNSFYGEDLLSSNRIWIEDNNVDYKFITKPRINITYAGEPWISKPWRFILSSEIQN